MERGCTFELPSDERSHSKSVLSCCRAIIFSKVNLLLPVLRLQPLRASAASAASAATMTSRLT